MSDDKNAYISDIMQMLDEAESRFLELGAVLKKLKATQPAEFAGIADATTLGRRRAYYLIEIDRVFGAMELLQPRLMKIGWSKLSLIARHVNPANLEELLHLAETSAAHELRAYLKKGTPGLGARVLLLSLDAHQFERIWEVLIANGAYLTPKGIHNKEAALLQALSKVPLEV